MTKKSDAVHSYWVRKSLLALAIRHPQVILENDEKIVSVVVRLAHETADAYLKVEEEKDAPK